MTTPYQDPKKYQTSYLSSLKSQPIITSSIRVISSEKPVIKPQPVDNTPEKSPVSGGREEVKSRLEQRFQENNELKNGNLDLQRENAKLIDEIERIRSRSRGPRNYVVKSPQLQKLEIENRELESRRSALRSDIQKVQRTLSSSPAPRIQGQQGYSASTRTNVIRISGGPHINHFRVEQQPTSPEDAYLQKLFEIYSEENLRLQKLIKHSGRPSMSDIDRIVENHRRIKEQIENILKNRKSHNMSFDSPFKGSHRISSTQSIRANANDFNWKNDALQGRISNAQAEINSLKKLNSQLNSQAQINLKTIQVLTTDNNILQNRVKELSNNNTDDQSLLGQLKIKENTIQSLAAENIRLKSSPVEKQLKENIEELKKEIERRDEIITSLKLTMKKTKSPSSQENDKLRRENEHKTRQIAILMRDISNLRTDLELAASRASIHDDRVLFEQQLEEKDKEIERLSGVNQNLNIHLNNLQLKINSLPALNIGNSSLSGGSLKPETQSQIEELNTLRHEKDGLEKKLSQFENVHQKDSAQLRIMNQLTQNQKNEIENLRKDIAFLRKQLELSKKNAIFGSKLEDDIRDKNKIIANLEEELRRMKLDLSEISRHPEFIKATTSHEIEVQDLKDEIERLEDNNKQFREICEGKDREFEDTVNFKDSQIKMLTAEIDACKTEIDRLRKHQAPKDSPPSNSVKLRRTISDLNTQIEVMEDNLREMAMQNESDKERYDEELDYLNKMNQTYQDDIIKLRKANQQLERDYLELKRNAVPHFGDSQQHISSRSASNHTQSPIKSLRQSPLESIGDKRTVKKQGANNSLHPNPIQNTSNASEGELQRILDSQMNQLSSLTNDHMAQLQHNIKLFNTSNVEFHEMLSNLEHKLRALEQLNSQRSYQEDPEQEKTPLKPVAFSPKKVRGSIQNQKTLEKSKRPIVRQDFDSYEESLSICSYPQVKSKPSELFFGKVNLDDFSRLLSELRLQIQILSKQRKSQDQQFKVLAGTLTELLNGQQVAIENNYRNIAHRLENLRYDNELEELKIRNQELSATNNAIEGNSCSQENQILRLKTKIQENKSFLNTLTDENEQLNRAQKDLKMRLAELGRDLNMSTNDKEEAERKLRYSKMENKKLKTLMQCNTKEILAMKKKIAQLVEGQSTDPNKGFKRTDTSRY